MSVRNASLAIVAACCAGVAAAQEAISRPVTVFNVGAAPVAVDEAHSRGVTVFNAASASPFAASEAIGRSVSVCNSSYFGGGDLECDADVDLSDLSGFLGVFGLCEEAPGFLPAADLDGSGCIDLADLSGLLSVFGATP